MEFPFECPVCGHKTNMPQTNADKIRAMSDEELAEFVLRNGINTLCDIICGGECNAIASFKKSGDEACKEIVMKWLKQSAEEGERWLKKTLKYRACGGRLN